MATAGTACLSFLRSPQINGRSYCVWSPAVHIQHRRLSLSSSSSLNKYLPLTLFFSGGIGNGPNGPTRFPGEGGGGSDDAENSRNYNIINMRSFFQPTRCSGNEYYFSSGNPGSIIRFKDVHSYNEYVAGYYEDYYRHSWILTCLLPLILLAIGHFRELREEEELRKAKAVKQDPSINYNK